MNCHSRILDSLFSCFPMLRSQMLSDAFLNYFRAPFSDLINTAGSPEGDMQNNTSNFLELLSSKNIACDYLKKLENSWELPNHTLLVNKYNIDSVVELEHNPPSNFSDMVNNQSYSPYDLELHRYQISLNNSLLSSDTSDSYSFSNYFNKSTMEPEKHKPSIKKQGYGNCASPTMESGRISGSSDGKMKRSGNSLGTVLSEKSKIGNSSTCYKVRNAERISAFQQLVSPLGKADVASVLMETHDCIKYLHEQVQLLSDPYMNPRPTQDNNPLGEEERRDISREPKYELRSRGLCLVPVSCTLQTYKENTGPEYWPTHRGCFYR